MSFLAISGLDIPIAAREDAGYNHELIGFRGRAFSGTLRDNNRIKRRAWRYTTPIIGEAQAEEIEQLLLGNGWRWSFDSSLYSETTGLGPDTGYNCSINTTTKVFGAGSVYLANGVADLVFNCGITGSWSVSFYQYVAAWVAYTITYNADTGAYIEYVSGTAGTGIDNTYRNAVVSAGKVHLRANKATDNSANDVYYDDLVVMPWVATPAMALAYANVSAGFSSLPNLDCSGDYVTTTGTVVCRGSDVQVKQQCAVINGVWTDKARTVSFVLQGVTS